MNKEEAKKKIDADDASINGVKLITTCRAKGIIDAIDDHPKVKLPREVGKELDAVVAHWKPEYATRTLTHILLNLEYGHDRTYHQNLSDWYDKEDNAAAILADAYRYGWEAEPEAKWYVKAPESWKADGGGRNWLYKPSQGGIDMCGHTGESDEQFTRAELKQYHFDSDIFTLVPVEEEK